MGDIVTVKCGGCGLSIKAAAGVGFHRTGNALLACDGCGALKVLPINDSDLPLGTVACPDCHQATRLICPIPDEPWTATTPRSGGPCPRCHTELHLQVVGAWD